MKSRESIIHLICWLAFFTLIFYWQSNVYSIDGAMLHAGLAVFIGAFVFYMNLNLFLPTFFDKTKYLKYTLAILLLVLVSSYVFDIVYEWLPLPEFMSEIRERGGRPPRVERGGWISIRVFMFAGFNILPMLFFSTIIWLSAQNRKRKQHEITLKNENLKSEMRFLKSQINPHFLFNALNNIYSLSFAKSESTPNMIMKLSDMLRHVVYDSSNLVRLEKEIAYIRNFIDFQQLRIGDEVNITFNCDQVDNRFMIEPMLLTPFVENAFKHSDIESNSEGFIKIELKTEEKKLSFRIENTFDPESLQHTKDKTPGIGIQNVTKRLELAYPEHSKLTKMTENNIFRIELELSSE